MAKDMMKNHYLIAFMTTLTVSITLFITSFFIPPKGKVDPSVLTGIAEMLLWPVLAFGAKSIEEGRTYRIQKGDLSISVGDSKEKEEKEEE